jgi:hypothetical protein
MQRAFELGIDVPKTLEGWIDFFPRYTILPWLRGKKHDELQTMREYLRIAFDRIPIGVQQQSKLQRIVHGMIGAPARWRLDHSFYTFPFEIWMKQQANRLASPPKSKVDAHQLEAEVVTC